MVSSDRPVSLEDEVSHSMKEMIGGCCVCSDERGWAENPLVYCDGHGCSVAVHQACYGIVQVPTGPWFCRKCESQERAARVWSRMDVRIGLERKRNAEELILLLEKTLQSPCKEIKPVEPKGNQSRIFIGRTDAEAPVLWPPNVKNRLIGRDTSPGKD
uniref:MLLT10 histone lysine methyltransferase DOT1L cofactor n=1 Tax=Ovis aries TaxID=9940 RepID=A0AC11D752_SHEEP